MGKVFHFWGTCARYLGRHFGLSKMSIALHPWWPVVVWTLTADGGSFVGCRSKNKMITRGWPTEKWVKQKKSYQVWGESSQFEGCLEGNVKLRVLRALKTAQIWLDSNFPLKTAQIGWIHWFFGHFFGFTFWGWWRNLLFILSNLGDSLNFLLNLP